METVDEILDEINLEAKDREMRSRAVTALERIADALERARLEEKDDGKTVS